MVSLQTIRERIGAVIAPSLVEKRDLALRAANTDTLTGLGNRAAFDLALPQALADQSAFILFDLNNFGLVNKVLGHSLGDEILKHIGAGLGIIARLYICRAFRVGGDEFVIICSPSSGSIIRDRAESFIKPFRFPGFEVSITGEVGQSVEDADSRLQGRKAIRKLAGLVFKEDN